MTCWQLFQPELLQKKANREINFWDLYEAGLVNISNTIVLNTAGNKY